jgi:DNA polymerase-3 subunit delta'
MPKKFQWPIVGHKKIVDFLQQSIDKQQLSHAYIFYGTEHLGKKTIAKYFVKSLFCSGYHHTPPYPHQGGNDIPCQQCAHCKQFDDKIHPDLVIIKRIVDSKTGKLKKNISIEQIKEMRDKLSLGSFLKNYKIAIIEDADKLSASAANALLKILEEPKGKTIFVLLTAQLDVIPQTVVSRCQKIKFLPVSFSVNYDYLVKEKKVNRSAALSLAALIAGKPGLAEYFAKEKKLKEYYKNLENDLSLIQQDDYQRIDAINSLLPKNIELEEQKSITLDFLEKWKVIIRDLLLIKNTPLSTGTKVRLINSDFSDSFKKEAEKYKNSQLVNLLDQIKQSKIYLNNNVSPKLILENFVLKL